MESNKSILKNYRKWQELNDEFSLFDYLFHQLREKEIDGDILFSVFELFWPSFSKHNQFVLLEEQFSQKRLEELIDQNQPVEYWMNLVLIDPYFEDDDTIERAQTLAENVASLWRVKLDLDFPGHDIIVKTLVDEETGDCGLTMYQRAFA